MAAVQAGVAAARNNLSFLVYNGPKETFPDFPNALNSPYGDLNARADCGLAPGCPTKSSEDEAAKIVAAPPATPSVRASMGWGFLLLLRFLGVLAVPDICVRRDSCQQ